MKLGCTQGLALRTAGEAFRFVREDRLVPEYELDPAVRHVLQHAEGLVDCATEKSSRPSLTLNRQHVSFLLQRDGAAWRLA